MAENAKHRLDMEITGMVGGIGDRKLHFEIQFPADDLEMANAGWYLHLGRLLCGCEENNESLGAAVNRVMKVK